MRRGFLKDAKTTSKEAPSAPSTTSSKRSDQAPQVKPTVQLQDGQDLDTWAGKLHTTPAELQKKFHQVLSQKAGYDVYRNIWLVDFWGVILADHTILELLPEEYSSRPKRLKDAYEIKEAEGKGSGMFATQDIPAGAVICVENPIFVLPPITKVSENLSREEITKTAFARLDDQVRAQALTLANCKPADVCCLEEGIIRTNGFMVKLPVPKNLNAPDATHSATFLDMSRCNHSCGPNSSHVWDIKTFSESLTALRPIKIGEEITLSYTGETVPRETRRARLMSAYYFMCKCEYCDRSDAEVAASDKARLEIQKRGPDLVSGKLARLCTISTLPVSHWIEYHRAAMVQHEQEGLWNGMHATHINWMAVLYAQLGDEKMFQSMGRKAVERYEVLRDYEQAAKMRAWIAKPTEHQLWGIRRAGRARS